MLEAGKRLAFHTQFVQTLKCGGTADTAAEAANASGIQWFLPWKILTGRPLVGNGGTGGSGTGNGSHGGSGGDAGDVFVANPQAASPGKGGSPGTGGPGGSAGTKGSDGTINMY